MRLISSIGICLIILLMTACQGTGRESSSVQQPQQDNTPQLHRIPNFNLTDTLQVGSHKWIYSIHREADDSLQIVTDEEGERYVDNFYLLSVVKDGKPFFKKRFTKQDFVSRLSSEFRKYGVLDGCRFNRYENGKLYFSMCVSYPESDEFTPFLLLIGPDGSHSIEADDMFDVGDIELSDEMEEKLQDIKENEVEE